MKFIKLTLLGCLKFNKAKEKLEIPDNTEAYVNIEQILYMYRKGTRTYLQFANGKERVIETPEEIMKMINGAVEQLVDSETPEEIWTTKNGTPKITDEELREMMKDPKYWKDQDPEYVKKVENGFKKLYSDK